MSFAQEFKKRAVSNAITVDVTIDGMLVLDGLGLDEPKEEEEEVEVFVKIRQRDSISALFKWELGDDEIENEKSDNSSPKKASSGDYRGSGGRSASELSGEEINGTFIPTRVKTFASRGVQSGMNTTNVTGPHKIPARFSGTMTAPMFFEGLLLTPDHFAQLLQKASEKSLSRQTIPVLFKGGMLTNAFKERVKCMSTQAEGIRQVDQARVKFEGHLKDFINPLWCRDGIPVLLDGKITF